MNVMNATMERMANTQIRIRSYGMIIRKSQLKTPSTIFGTPRCFSPKVSRINASRKNAIPAASSMVLSSRADRLMTGPNRNFSIAAPSSARVTHDIANAKTNGIPNWP